MLGELAVVGCIGVFVISAIALFVPIDTDVRIERGEDDLTPRLPWASKDLGKRLRP